MKKPNELIDAAGRADVAKRINAIKHSIEFAGPTQDTFGGSSWDVGTIANQLEELADIVAMLAGCTQTRVDERTILERTQWTAGEDFPSCPDCHSDMIYIDEDMTCQGGPSAKTWLCSDPSCGRCIKA